MFNGINFRFVLISVLTLSSLSIGFSMSVYDSNLNAISNSAHSNETLIGIGNYNLSDLDRQEYNSKFSWYKNNQIIKSGLSKTIYNMESDDSSYISTVANNKGTVAELNCNLSKKRQLFYELGLKCFEDGNFIQ